MYYHSFTTDITLNNPFRFISFCRKWGVTTPRSWMYGRVWHLLSTYGITRSALHKCTGLHKCILKVNHCSESAGRKPHWAPKVVPGLLSKTIYSCTFHCNQIEEKKQKQNCTFSFWINNKPTFTHKTSQYYHIKIWRHQLLLSETSN